MDFIFSFFSHMPESTLKKDLDDFKEKPKEELEIDIPPSKDEAKPTEEKKTGKEEKPPAEGAAKPTEKKKDEGKQEKKDEGR